MSYKYKVRFNLGRGENYMKWKVIYKDNNSSCYLDPKEFNLTMFRCKLMNQKGTAEKIKDGANKTVCAWIECENLVITPTEDYNAVEDTLKVSYNPRVNPYWTLDGENVDKQEFKELFTIGSSVNLKK